MIDDRSGYTGIYSIAYVTCHITMHHPLYYVIPCTMDAMSVTEMMRAASPFHKVPMLYSAHVISFQKTHAMLYSIHVITSFMGTLLMG